MNSRNTNKSENLSLNKRLEKMLGPPPQSIDKDPPPEPAKPEPPVAPVKSASPKVEDEPPKEKLLVVPPEEPTDEATESPKAGETVVPSKPETNKSKQPNKGGKLRRFFRKLWGNPLSRRLLIFFTFALLIGIAVFPNSRYFILNNVGVRSSASLTVLDNSTQLPLKNVDVTLAGQSTKTDSNGRVFVQHIKLGPTNLVIQKRAFAVTNEKLTIGWGSNPLGNYKLDPTGSQYAIFVRDWLTGKAITKASASGGGADALADQKGKILLTIDTTIAQHDKLPVAIQASGYRTENYSLNLDTKGSHNVAMVTERKDVYVSNESGKYDVYTVDIDGKNAKLALAGTGLERDDVSLVQHPSENVAALVSTRVNARNSDNYLLSTLTIINLEDNTTTAIAQSEQVQIIGWIGNRVVYVQIAAGASAADPQRFRLMSYDFKTADKKELAAANDFNDVLLEGSSIYYAPSGAYQKDPTVGLIQVNADGSAKKVLLSKEVWNIFRVSYDTLNIATAKTWYEYKLGSQDSPTELKEAPADPKNRLYITSLDSKHSLWIDEHNGLDMLIDYDTNLKADKTLVTQDGASYPVKWLTNSVLVYRVHTDEETADYVLDITGGKAHKIIDVYKAPGIDRWYYYN